MSRPGQAGVVFELSPAGVPVVIRADGLVLRERTLGDVASLVALYATSEMDRRTPVASPFDEAAARRYVDGAHRARRDRGTLQLAITEDRDQLVGEVLAFPTDDVDTVELAYAVQAASTGRGIASTASRVRRGRTPMAPAARVRVAWHSSLPVPDLATQLGQLRWIWS